MLKIAVAMEAICESSQQPHLHLKNVCAYLGIKRAAQGGQHIGRPKAEEAVDAFLSKPKSRAITAVLSQHLSLRETARQIGVSVNTVQKVKALLSQRPSQIR